jgi:hypothetical protein
MKRIVILIFACIFCTGLFAQQFRGKSMSIGTGTIYYYEVDGVERTNVVGRGQVILQYEENNHNGKVGSFSLLIANRGEGFRTDGRNYIGLAFEESFSIGLPTLRDGNSVLFSSVYINGELRTGFISRVRFAPEQAGYYIEVFSEGSLSDLVYYIEVQILELTTMNVSN